MVAIIYTTFLRDELMKETISSIQKNIPKTGQYHLIVGDQSPNAEKRAFFEALVRSNGRVDYLPLKFDCGLSEARNRLILMAQEKGFELCLLTADSIAFDCLTMRFMKKAISLLTNCLKFDLLGFELTHRVPWEFYMDIGTKDEDRFFEFSRASDIYEDPDTGLDIVECDICRNFFLATTSSLCNVMWDTALKMAEHEDFFWRYKQAGYKVAWTPDITGQYIYNRSEEYSKYRNRYHEFQTILMKKYQLTQWARYV